jgi:hypothetical protein
MTMRKVLLSIWAIALAAALAPSARADDPKPPGPPDPGKIFDKLDANHDGVITPDEVPAGAPERLKALLARADKKGDKRITREAFLAAAKEMRAARLHGPAFGPHGMAGPPREGHHGMAGPSPGHHPPAAHEGSRIGPFDLKALFAQFDKNKDGKLSEEEFIAGMKQLHHSIVERFQHRSGMAAPGQPGPGRFSAWWHGPRGPMAWFHGRGGPGGPGSQGAMGWFRGGQGPMSWFHGHGGPGASGHEGGFRGGHGPLAWFRGHGGPGESGHGGPTAWLHHGGQGPMSWFHGHGGPFGWWHRHHGQFSWWHRHGGHHGPGAGGFGPGPIVHEKAQDARIVALEARVHALEVRLAALAGEKPLKGHKHDGAKAACPKATCPKATCPKCGSPMATCPKATCPMTGCPMASCPKGTCPKATCPKCGSAMATCPKCGNPMATCPKCGNPKATCPKCGNPKATCPKCGCPKATCPKATCSKATCAKAAAKCEGAKAGTSPDAKKTQPPKSEPAKPAGK